MITQQTWVLCHDPGASTTIWSPSLLSLNPYAHPCPLQLPVTGCGWGEEPGLSTGALQSCFEKVKGIPRAEDTRSGMICSCSRVNRQTYGSLEIKTEDTNLFRVAIKEHTHTCVWQHVLTYNVQKPQNFTLSLWKKTWKCKNLDHNASFSPKNVWA